MHKSAMGREPTPCAVCGQPTRSVEGVCQRTAECKHEHQKRWYAARPGHKRALQRKHYRANPQIYHERYLRQYAKNREKIKAKVRPYEPEDWAAMYAQQEGLCYLCGRELDRSKPRSITMDHDHRCCPPTKSCATCRRGLAHSSCNFAIGQADDNPERLRRIADALEKAREEFEKRRAGAGEEFTLF